MSPPAGMCRELGTLFPKKVCVSTNECVYVCVSVSVGWVGGWVVGWGLLSEYVCGVRVCLCVRVCA